MACFTDNTDCVQALLLAGADVNKQATGDGDYTEPCYVGLFLQDNPGTLDLEDMKNGGTPVHWAKSRSVIEALIDTNCNINAVNFEGKSALHVMVDRNRFLKVSARMRAADFMLAVLAGWTVSWRCSATRPKRKCPISKATAQFIRR